jgi:oryzin
MVNFKKLAALAAAFLPAFAAPVENAARADTFSPESIAHSYIVTLKSGLESRDLEAHVGWVTDVHRRSLGRRELSGVDKTYDMATGFVGYSGKFDDATIEQIEARADVSFTRLCCSSGWGNRGTRC